MGNAPSYTVVQQKIYRRTTMVQSMCNLVFISSETEQPTVVRQLRLLNNFKKYIELLENFNFMGFIFHANLNEYLIMYLLHKKIGLISSVLKF